MQTDASGFWAELVRGAGGGASVDLWESLDRRLDLAAFVPTPASGTSHVAERRRDGSERHILRSPTGSYLLLDDTDYQLWRRMDGQKSVGQIAVEHFAECREFAAGRLIRLVGQLRAGGFLGPRPLDCFEALDAAMTRQKPVRRAVAAMLDALRRGCPSPAASDRFIAGLYRWLGWVVSSAAALVGGLAVPIGAAVWWHQVESAHHPLFQTRGSYLLGFATLIVLDGVGVTLHNLAQGMLLKRFGLTVPAAGVTFRFVVPALYVATSDAWMARRRQRVAISLAGPFALLVLGSLLALASYPLTGTELGGLLFKGATIWYANAAFNLLPLLDLAGYFALVDALDMPSLRANALGFIRRGLFERLRARQRLSRDEWIYVGFGFLTLVSLIAVPVGVLEARQLRYADGLLGLWNSGQPGAGLLAVGLAALFLGPPAAAVVRLAGRALLGFGAACARRWRAWRGRVPTENVEALRQLPFLVDVPRADILAIARYLRAERAQAGRILIRQGARGDRLYLLREGTVRVGKLTSDGRAVALARLGPGDYFGETALIARVPRTATVIAETDVRLLTLDGGHFRRYFTSQFALTGAIRGRLRERESLAAIPIFSALGPIELDRIAREAVVARYSPGDVIVRQGEVGDRFFVLTDGTVDVIRESPPPPTSLAVLSRGDFFGEMALLNAAPRAATVRARSAVEVLTLDVDGFRNLLGNLPVAAVIQRTASRRAASEQPTLIGS